MPAALRSSWRPMAHQEPVLAHDHGIDICVGGVGAGKSKVAAMKVLRWIARHPRRPDGRPTQGLILGKDFRNASGSQFLELRNAVRTLGLPENEVIVREKGMPAPTITFWNGVTAQAFTGSDPDASRSYEADWLWADEAECMDALSLVTSLGRLRAAKPIRAIVTSNPSGGGWIWPLLSGESAEWDAIRRENDVRAFRWASRQNKHIDEKTLRTMRAAYDAVAPSLSRQELGGRFLGTREAPAGGPIDFARAFVSQVEVTFENAAVVSADLGKSQDFCWFSALTSDATALAFDRFNAHTTDVAADDYWSYVRARLVQFVVHWGAGTVVVDSAKGGDHFASAIREDLARLGFLSVRVIDYATDAPGRKTAAIEAMGMALQLGRIRVPRAWSSPHRGAQVTPLAEDLRLEFVKLRAEQLPGGKRRFSHPQGGHDDGVVSLALAWHGLALNASSSPKANLFAMRQANIPPPSWRR